MNKLTTQIAVLTLAMGLGSIGFAAGPCMPIAQACMNNGYVKGGEKDGKGLIKDCIMPVVSGSKDLPNITFTDEQKVQCSAVLKQKMQQGQADNSLN